MFNSKLGVISILGSTTIGTSTKYCTDIYTIIYEVIRYILYKNYNKVQM